MINVQFDRPKLARFKKAVAAAKEKDRGSVWFDGQEYDVGYAKYMIEYLERSLPK